MDLVLKTGLEALVADLRRDGFDARRDRDIVHLGVGEAAVVVPRCGLACGVDEWEESVSLRVALRLREDRPPLFHDVVFHVGDTPEEAVVQALRAWRHEVLPPILPLIGGPALPEVRILDREGAFHYPPWTIYSGPYRIGSEDQE